jgi:quercetin dioxygenase-like cupin family protein
MFVTRGGDRSTAYGGRFSGRVELEMLREAAAEGEPDCALVHFSDGAVTYVHSHPGGQTLFVVAGRARVGLAGDAGIELGPGSLVHAPSGERHWHGAARQADCTLLATTWGTTVWEDLAPE